MRTGNAFLKLKFSKGGGFLTLIKSMVNFLYLLRKDRIRVTLDTFSDLTLPFWNTLYRQDSAAVGVNI